MIMMTFVFFFIEALKMCESREVESHELTILTVSNHEEESAQKEHVFLLFYII